MSQILTIDGTYFEENNPFILDEGSNHLNKAFNTFEDMLEDAIKRHNLIDEPYRYKFVPVYWALVNGKEINTVGMLRVIEGRIEFSHLEFGGREFENEHLCYKHAKHHRLPRPSSEDCIAFSINKFNEEVKENPDTPRSKGYNIIKVPFGLAGDELSESTIALLLTALTRSSLSSDICKRVKD